MSRLKNMFVQSERHRHALIGVVAVLLLSLLIPAYGFASGDSIPIVERLLASTQDTAAVSGVSGETVAAQTPAVLGSSSTDEVSGMDRSSAASDVTMSESDSSQEESSQVGSMDEEDASESLLLSLQDDGIAPMADYAAGDVNLISVDAETGVFSEKPKTTLDTIKSVSSLWSNAGSGNTLGGFALLADGSIAGTAFASGALNKHLCSSPLDGNPETIYALTLDATSFSAGTGTDSATPATTTFENMTLNLTNGSHLDALAGGALTFRNCTINMSGASYIANAGSLVFDGCTINLLDGASYISSTGGTVTIDGTAIDGGAASSPAVARSSAAIRLSGGTCTVGGTAACTVSNVKNTSTSSPGGVFNVSGSTTLDLDAVTITNCNSTGVRGSGGGSVLYLDAATATVNLRGADISGCGTTDASQYYNAPIAVNAGTFNMTGGSIHDNFGSHGGAITLTSAAAVASITGGTLSGNTCHYDGGALFMASNSSATVGGTAQLTGNVSGRNGAAIGMRSGSKLVISGSPTITGNDCTAAETEGGTTMGAVSGFSAGNYGTVTISGTPTITGNTYKKGNTGEQTADLAVYSTTALSVGDLGAAASVGICSPVAGLLAENAQFASYSVGSDNLSALFNDDNQTSGTTLFGTAGTTSGSVVWSSAVCKIGSVLFASIADAVSYAQANSLNTCTIEMLVSDYEVPAVVTIPSGYDITLQPAGGVTTSTLTRPAGTADKSSMFSVAAGGSFTVKTGMVLDGSGASNHRGITNYGTLTLDGATIENFNYTPASHDGGAAIYSTGNTYLKGTTKIAYNNSNGNATFGGAAIFARGGTLDIADDVLITENTGYDGAAIAGAGPVKITMSGESITKNYARNPGGGIYLYGTAEAQGANSSFTMTGGTISGNYARSYGGGGVFAHMGTTVNVSAGTISGNGSAGAGGGVCMWNGSAVLNLSGSPVITGNVQGASWSAATKTITGGTTSNAWLSNWSNQLVVTGDLSSTANVGVRAQDSAHNVQGSQFGISGTAPAAGYDGLYHLTNDVNQNLFGMAQDDTTNTLVWGSGTCQIIRTVNGTPTLIGIYATLAEACDAAQSGDAIEVFKSHELTKQATLSSTVTDVTITTAPVGTATAVGAHPYEPKTGESATTATITRKSTYTGIMFDVAGTGDKVGNLTFDGKGASAASAIKVESTGELTLGSAEGSGTTVKGCKNTGRTGAVDATSGGTLKVTATTNVHGNFDSAGNDNNVALSDTGTIGVVDGLSASSSIGVTVPNASHVAYHEFAQGYSNGVADTAVAAASVSRFFDDTNPVLSIGANQIEGHADLDTYIYFKPPTELTFQKVTDTNEHLPLPGATFHLYRYTGSGTPADGYLTDAELAADTDWSALSVTGSSPTSYDFTSASDGTVDCGGLDDGYMRIVETAAPDGCAAATCEWQVKVDSTQTDPNKFVFTTIVANGGTSVLFITGYNAATGEVSYMLPNVLEKAVLRVGKTVTGSYADQTRAFAFTARFSEDCTGFVYDEQGNAVGEAISFIGDEDKAFTLVGGQHLVVTNLSTWSTCVVTETDAKAGGTGQTGMPYSCTVGQTPGSVGNVSVDGAAKQATATFTEVGVTGVDFANDAVEAVATGVDAGGFPWWACALAAASALVALLVFKRRHAKRWNPQHRY